MARLYRYLLIITILLLMILGLNTSNQGINSLTLENRKPVIGLQNQGDTVNIYTLGQTHSYDKQEVREDLGVVCQQVKKSAQAVGNELLQFVRIFKNY